MSTRKNEDRAAGALQALPADRTKDKLLTTKEVAIFLNKAEQTLINHRFSNKGMPYVRIGRSIRYWMSDVIAHCQNRVTPANVEA